MAKALNAKNLSALGPDRLADLLIEVTKERADLQRRLRLELSAHQGTDDVARDIRKRYASIRQARGYLSRKTHRTFAKEIRSLITLIEARTTPDTAFDLLWELLHLGPGVLDRTKDGDILREAFAEVMTAIARRPVTRAPGDLADMLFDAVAQDCHGLFAGGVAALAVALGPQGLAHLKRAAARSGRTSLLRDIAGAEGDVDAYAAGFTPAQMRDPAVAADVAGRLLEAGRAEDALAVATRAGAEDLVIAALDALGRRDDLKAVLWRGFERRPDAGRLRHYMRLLPDFDDIEAEDAARRIVRAHPDHHAALRFFLDWPDLSEAAALVSEYSEGWGGFADRTAADALDARFPLAATVLRRAFILTAINGRASGHREAARLLIACAETDARIADHRGLADHQTFVARLRRSHARRRGFWKIVDADRQ